jgi:hypothetical protein
MKKPNAVLHMMGYGLVYGWLLAMLFIMVIVLLEQRNGGTTWYVSLQEFSVSARLAFIFGAVPGAIMGFIEGWILWLFTRHVKPQIHPEQLAGIRILTVSIIGALTFAGMAGVLLLLFPIVTLASLYILIPATLAGGAAAYAVHRYLLKLRTWANIGKTKNDYKAKNQLADTNFTYDESPVTAKDEAQVNELRSR